MEIKRETLNALITVVRITFVLSLIELLLIIGLSITCFKLWHKPAVFAPIVTENQITQLEEIQLEELPPLEELEDGFSEQ